MKIATFHPANTYTAWSMGGGWASTLRRMGFQVLDTELPTGQISRNMAEYFKEQIPSIEDLKECDAVLISGPEHIGPYIDLFYGREQWNGISVPKAAWLHESLFREDYDIDFGAIRWMADEWFFPGIQDAEYCDQEQFALGHSHWLPLGVDTEIFRPCDDCESTKPHGRFFEDVKRYPLAFIGSIYEKRAKYLNALARHEHPRIRIGTCSITDLDGFDAEGTAQRLASNYRRIEVFFNLPAISQMLVSKVFEVMACGVFLITPMLKPEQGISRNMELFQDTRHLLYYRAANLPGTADLLRQWTSEERRIDRTLIAATGMREVREKHSLRQRMETILSKLGIFVPIQKSNLVGMVQ